MGNYAKETGNNITKQVSQWSGINLLHCSRALFGDNRICAIIGDCTVVLAVAAHQQVAIVPPVCTPAMLGRKQHKVKQ